MGLFSWYQNFKTQVDGGIVLKELPAQHAQAPANIQGTTRSPDFTYEAQSLRASLQPSMGLRNKILTIRKFDKDDPRVKKIHNKMARDTVRGGLILDWTDTENPRITKIFKQFIRRLNLKKIDKLKSDARQFAVQGNLALQWVLDKNAHNISACLSMPVDTLVPNVLDTGQLADPKAAYYQMDFFSGKILATFAQWQLTVVRLDPDNYDDLASLGRPYLDATEKALLQLIMAEEDLVVRRRTRAANRNLFTFEGAGEKDLEKYQDKFESKAHDVSADYYASHKAAVHQVGGDANMDQIADVAHLLDTVFTGAPAPKGLFGYVGDLSRDVLEDLKKDYFDEIDELQDSLATVYQQGFEYELMLNDIDPRHFDFTVKFKERRTESPNQKADQALKLAAIGASTQTVHKTAGLDPVAEQERLKAEKKAGIESLHGNEDDDPDGNVDSNVGKKAKVSITPNNAKKNESATNITNK